MKDLKDVSGTPRSWRTDWPGEDALRGILIEVGYADALVAFETPAGLKLIDGHLRAETTPEMEVPVLVLDVTEDEAKKLLATLDPLAGLAEPDPGGWHTGSGATSVLPVRAERRRRS